jgi:hypothetical protein
MNDNDVLVYKIDEDHCQVLPPPDGEAIGMSNTRLFLLACLHKRALDPAFEEDLRLWISSYEPEEFRKAVASSTKHRMDN